MICDMHTHSDISADCQTPMAAYCERALEMGIDAICFTDHLDHNPLDAGYGFYDRTHYFQELEEVREQYEGRLLLLSGVEFGEPHRYPKQLEEVHRYPYDYILGSIHFWKEDVPARKMAYQPILVEKSFDIYWEEVRKAVSHGGFDALAHMDYPSRYYLVSLYEEDRIREIFSIMEKNRIILEINTASTRRGVSEPNPSHELLSFYRECGGKYYTLGADAHKTESFGDKLFIEDSRAKKLGLKQVYFRERNMIVIS